MLVFQRKKIQKISKLEMTKDLHALLLEKNLRDVIFDKRKTGKRKKLGERGSELGLGRQRDHDVRGAHYCNNHAWSPGITARTSNGDQK